MKSHVHKDLEPALMISFQQTLAGWVYIDRISLLFSVQTCLLVLFLLLNQLRKTSRTSTTSTGMIIISRMITAYLITACPSLICLIQCLVMAILWLCSVLGDQSHDPAWLHILLHTGRTIAPNMNNMTSECVERDDE